MSNLKVAFKNQIIELPISQIQYSKKILETINLNSKFKVILESIKSVGIIEPPMVYENEGIYTLVDGHLRVEALKILGETTVQCLLAKDDETFTYNKHINRMANVQEHRMIMKAIEKGASAEKIAKALNIEVSSIIRKKSLLDGICPAAIELLKDKVINKQVFDYLKRMTPERQIEALSYMASSSDYSAKFARAIWLGSSDNQLINPIRKARQTCTEETSKLENEVSRLQKEYHLMEDDYGKNVGDLTVIKAYLHQLFQNAEINKFIKENETDIYQRFERIVEMDSLL